MCTLLLLRRPGHDWPLILGANRDEMRDRPWQAPGRHWPELPGVVAGRDLLSGGSWLGLNRQGVVAAVLNRRGSLGPLAGKRSRGELVLQALAAETAKAAAADLEASDSAAYRSYNLVVADSREAFWLRHSGAEGAARPEVFPLPEGPTMLTAGDRNDPTSPRVRRYLPLLEAASPPDPTREDWAAWRALLADRGTAEDLQPAAAMNLDLAGGFGTVSSSLLALRGAGSLEIRWLFAAGRPDEVSYKPVILDG